MLTKFYMTLDPNDRDVILAEDVVKEVIRDGLTFSQGVSYIKRYIGMPSESMMRAPTIEAVHQLRTYEIARALNKQSGFWGDDHNGRGHYSDNPNEEFDISNKYYQQAVRISLGCNEDGKVGSPVPAWASLEQKRIALLYQSHHIAADALLPLFPSVRRACAQRHPLGFFGQ